MKLIRDGTERYLARPGELLGFALSNQRRRAAIGLAARRELSRQADAAAASAAEAEANARRQELRRGL